MIVIGEGVCEWVAPRTGGQYYGGGVGIGIEKDGALIAGVIFDQCNGRSINMHVAAIPGKRWMTKEFLHLCFSYPFDQLKVNKIIISVDSANTEAYAFDKHCGFHDEHTITDAGNLADLHILSMTRQQCRFLKD